MKIFWSWQSDHDGKISHYFVRDALNDAIKTLKAESVLEEPSELERCTELHLDHDTKGRTGWVDITQSIFEKIEDSAIFIADVTPVAFSPSKLGKDGKEMGLRPIMNPNVAIELGYALKALDWSKIIPVMNTAYGSVERMPFDIDRSRRWAITYDLKEGSSNAEIKVAQTKLAREFIGSLRGFLSVTSTRAPFKETKPQIAPGLFFANNDVLAVQRNNPLSNGSEFNFRISHRTYAYLRVIPTTSLKTPLPEQLLKTTIGRYGSFGTVAHPLLQENDFGVALSAPVVPSLEIESITQYFRNGEIWGVNASISHVANGGNENWISALSLENLFITHLELYCAYMTNHSGVISPVTVEAGIAGVKNMRLVYDGLLSALDKMYEPEVVHRAVLPDYGPEIRDAFLKRFLEKVHENTGIQRPAGLFSRW